MPNNKFELPEDTSLARKVIDSETKMNELKMKAGWLGAFFGSTNNAGLYIVGLVCLILILTATIYTFCPNTSTNALSAEKLWTIILPVITTLIGFIFGSSTKSKNGD
jgi:hypothetical protein